MHIMICCGIARASLNPTKKRPNTHSHWSLSERPIAKNNWPMQSKMLMVSKIERMEKLSRTKAKIRGGTIEANYLTE